ncbi:winged helix-turn-helix domain-containing protein [Altererythrobacter arenosus]|uniref:Winged helix-turn-helix domain-containing protein n=1 Tax=Altererythrobacter arenosus TaxID=3032592 RepID=A0ABY8FW86_9SPHN|nr:winged helix-turn-helix domain-containing protein [Altererythrobacter sp. CAU 1644]WFL77656.1 winged helix-turn-helix domain-containing protein [Altererythrobacter sp. CAU 1644]
MSGDVEFGQDPASPAPRPGNGKADIHETHDLAKRPDITIGDTLIRPSLRLIAGPNSSVSVEPRVMQVLLALYDADGKVLNREDLLEQCWAGVVVGDDAINRAIAELRRAVRETNADLAIETISRVGYRLAANTIPDALDSKSRPIRGFDIDRRNYVLGGAVAAVALAGGTVAISGYREKAAVDQLIERGKILQGSGAPDGRERAFALFSAAVERAPKRAEAWGWLSTVAPNYQHSRSAALRALDLDPKEPNARVVLAWQKLDLEDWTVWEDSLLEVLDDAPENALALGFITLFYQGMGRCKLSLQMNERSLAAEPFNPGFHMRRALKHWIFGRLAEADKVADKSMHLWPRNPFTWNARMVIYAFTDRAPAALTLLEDEASRPKKLTQPNIESWRAALRAIDSRSRSEIDNAVKVCTAAAPLAPGLAANAIMFFSHLGELDSAYRVAEGLFEGKGNVVQQTRGVGIRDIYSATGWGRTQFVFIPATNAFRDDERFPGLCRRLGLEAYWRKRGAWPDEFVRGALVSA